MNPFQSGGSAEYVRRVDGVTAADGKTAAGMKASTWRYQLQIDGWNQSKRDEAFAQQRLGFPGNSQGAGVINPTDDNFVMLFTGRNNLQLQVTRIG